MKTVKNIIFSFMSQFVVLLVPIITTPYLSRVLGVDNIGIYSYYYSIANYFGLFIMLGLSVYGVRTIAQCQGDKTEYSKKFWSIYCMQLIIGIIVIMVYFVFILFISDNKLASVLLLFYVISNLFDITWFFFGIGEFVKTSIRNSVIRILTVLAIFIFVKSAEDTYIYIFIMSISFFISQILLWLFMIKKVFLYRPNIKEIIVHIKPNLFLFITVLAISIYNLMDKIMLGFMASKTEVGYYESAQKIIQVPIAFITAMGTVMLSRTSSKINDNNNTILRFSFLFSILIMSALCYGIMGVSKEFVPLFYGDGYDKCIYLYLIMLPASIFIGFGNIIRTQYLLPNKKDVVYVISAVLGAVTNLIINAILIPIYGCIGAAIGTLFTEMVVCVVQTVYSNKKLKVGIYICDCIPFVIVGLLMFSSIYFIDFEFTIIVNMIIKIGIGALLYLVLTCLVLIIFKKRYKYIIQKIINH